MTPPADPDRKLHEVPAATPPAEPPRKKRRAPLVVGLVVLLVGAGLGVRAFALRGDETTDDAQVEADVVAVAPRIGGTIAEVLVSSDTVVEAGQPLVRLDDADLAVKVKAAEAELETARAQVASAVAQVAAARATVTRAEAEAEKARLDLDRAEALRQGGAIAAERYDQSRLSSETTRAGAGANRAQYAAALAAESLANARVRSAEAALELARLQRSYAVVKAPARGTVSRVGARVGQIVQAGQALGQLVPASTYVVANFKETQTGGIHAGQAVEVEVDAYPGRTLHGKVETLSGGTGARFALLPPDNASGNFVKVVERVPVRISWTDAPADLAMRAGLSATVTVHTR
ncbi:MAG: HlyD family secretion protein [Anaeromyxobacteraceae bacterium]